VQLYLGLPDESSPRPLRELKGFQRVELKAGETRVITLPLPGDSLLYWHPVQNRWVQPEGAIKVEIGLSERDIRQQKTLPPLSSAAKPAASATPLPVAIP
jgi:beta-glucosidase